MFQHDQNIPLEEVSEFSSRLPLMNEYQPVEPNECEFDYFQEIFRIQTEE